MKKGAFSFDVEPGGLRTTAEIKILICYLLKTVNTPLPRRLLDEVMQENGLANYFDAGQALAELLDNGSIQKTGDGEECYTVTEQGRNSADTLETTLSFSVREKAVGSAMRLLAKVKHERENRVEVQKVEGGYAVSCSVLDRNLELMTVRLLVADSLQAEMVREQFLKDPLTLYQHLLAMLTGDPAFGASES